MSEEHAKRPGPSAEARAKAAETRRQNREERARLLIESLRVPAEPEPFDPTGDDDLSLDNLLSKDEIEEIRRTERVKFLAEQKRIARDAAIARVRAEVRDEIGATPEQEAHNRWLAELETVTINLPRLRQPNGREAPPEPLRINGRRYDHGRTYTVERGLAQFLMWQMNQAHMHVAQVDGRSRNYYNEQTGRMMYQGGPMSGGAPSMSFEGIHRRPAA